MKKGKHERIMKMESENCVSKHCDDEICPRIGINMDRCAKALLTVSVWEGEGVWENVRTRACYLNTL